MSLYVVDASVALKWLLPAHSEPLVGPAARLLLRYTRREVDILVPDLFWAEVGNALWNAVRRSRSTRAAAAAAIRTLREYNLPTASSFSLVEPAFEIAVVFDRTVYDCIYVALARESGGELLTADERLANSLAAYQPVKWLGAL
jgi:predicted nucleic acid-binding protein